MLCPGPTRQCGFRFAAGLVEGDLDAAGDEAALFRVRSMLGRLTPTLMTDWRTQCGLPARRRWRPGTKPNLPMVTVTKAGMIAACDMEGATLHNGAAGWLRAAAIAGGANLPLSSHLYPESSSHLLRVSESADWLECGSWGNPFLQEPFDVHDGAIHLPDRPGAGIA
jgi:hypothetical protein